MASNDASNAIENFQPITKVIGTPTFKAINARHKVLRQNSSSILTTLAGGNHGLLALIVNAADYTALTGAVWIEPVNSGVRPIIPVGATRVAQENITSQWKNEFEAWKMTQDVREALKKQILNAIDDEYLKDLKDPDTGYANVSPLQMIEHLYTEYGELTPQDISNNRTDLKADFGPTTTMVSYFYKIGEIRNIAVRAGNPIMEAHLANYANAATADREAVANLTQTNATLVATNAELTTKMNQCSSKSRK